MSTKSGQWHPSPRARRKHDARMQTGEFATVQALVSAVEEQAQQRGWPVSAKVTRDEIRHSERHSECEFKDTASGRKVIVDCMPAIADMPFCLRFFNADGTPVFIQPDVAASVATAQGIVVLFLKG